MYHIKVVCVCVSDAGEQAGGSVTTTQPADSGDSGSVWIFANYHYILLGIVFAVMSGRDTKS